MVPYRLIGLWLALCLAAASGTQAAPAWGENPQAATYPAFAPADAEPRYSTDNLVLTSTLVPGGAPYPGTHFTVLREEPDAFGKTRLKTMANSGPNARAGFSLAPGRYRVQARNGAVTVERPLEIPARGALHQEVPLDAGILDISSVLRAGGEPAEQSWFRVFRDEPDSYGRPSRVQVAGNGYASQADFLLPAGRYLVEVRMGDTRREQSIDVAAGLVAPHEFILDAGVVALHAVLSADGEPAHGARFSVHRKQTDADGHERWTEFAGSDPAPSITFVLPQGEYLARASLGRATVDRLILVSAGEIQSSELVLDAGEVLVFATLSNEDEVLLDSWFWLQAVAGSDAAAANIDSTPLGPFAKASFIVPAGRYKAMAKVDQALGGTIIDVVAGTNQRVSVPIPGARMTLRLQDPTGAGPVEPCWFSIYRVETTQRGAIRHRIFNDGFFTEARIILPVGDYVASAHAGNLVGEAAFSVHAGESRTVLLAPRP